MNVETRIKMIVRQVLEAYLKEQIQDKEKTSIAILLGYQSRNPEGILEAVTQIIKSYHVRLIISKDWLWAVQELQINSYVLIEDTTKSELLNIVESSTVLAVPVASYHMLSKLALTIDDELAVWLAIQYQLLGKRLVMAKDEVEPDVYQQIHAPHTVLERIQSYILQIQAAQVKWVPLLSLKQSIGEQYDSYQDKQSLILAKHVEKAWHDGLKEIIVPPKAMMTPAARDLAMEMKIQINKNRSLKGGT